ncbi:MAG: spore coat protein U domain-containing protein [Desulfobacterales bacterium]
MTKKLFAIVIGLALVFSAGLALAGNTSGTADYSVTLISGCTVDTSAMGTDFGTYFIGDPDLVNAAAGSVTITCANGLNYAWGVNRGINPPGTQWLRMHDGVGNYIQYRLFQGGVELGDVGMTAIDPVYTQSWTGFTDRDATGTGLPQTYNLNANVEISAGTVAGTYTDTVTVTVVWP